MRWPLGSILSWNESFLRVVSCHIHKASLPHFSKTSQGTALEIKSLNWSPLLSPCPEPPPPSRSCWPILVGVSKNSLKNASDLDVRRKPVGIRWTCCPVPTVMPKILASTVEFSECSYFCVCCVFAVCFVSQDMRLGIP